MQDDHDPRPWQKSISECVTVVKYVPNGENSIRLLNPEIPAGEAAHEQQNSLNLDVLVEP
jgi:hypothetical protein